MSSRTVTPMSRSCGCSRAKMEFRLGSEQRVCGQGDVVVIPGGTEHEAWFLEDTEVIDFFAPPRDLFLLGGKPAYIDERANTSYGPPPGPPRSRSTSSWPRAVRLKPQARFAKLQIGDFASAALKRTGSVASALPASCLPAAGPVQWSMIV